jgi:hypothetical protein
MLAEAITIHVDAEAARAYRSVSEEQRRKFDLLLNLRLREVTQSGQSLEEVMRTIGQKAQERGLVHAELEAALRGEGPDG